jgi:hypothetical protein
MKDGKREGRRFAGAGLGYADEVAARHDGRNACAWIGVGRE